MYQHPYAVERVEMQVPAESRIRMADMLRLLFHFFNIVNLTLGLIVFGIGVSLTASPLPIDVSKEVSHSIQQEVTIISNNK